MPFLCGWHQNNFLRTHLTPWKVALFAALFLLLLWGAAVWGPRLRKRLSKRAVTGVTLLVLLCLQFVFATAAYTEIGFDCGQLIQLAQEGEKALTDGYLLQFPNNVTLTLLWQIWWKLTQAFFSDIWFACIVLNILFVDAAIYFCCRIADRFYSERVFWITWVLAVLELGSRPICWFRTAIRWPCRLWQEASMPRWPINSPSERPNACLLQRRLDFACFLEAE